MCKPFVCLALAGYIGGISRKFPTGQHGPSKLPKLNPFRRDGRPARFMSYGNYLGVLFFESNLLNAPPGEISG